MRIRAEQIERFSQALADAFAQRMVVHLRDDFREQRQARGIESADLETLVREGIADADKHGVQYEGDIERYLECIVLLGPKFDRKAGWARKILRRDDLDGSGKMDAIVDYLIFRAEEPPL